MNFDPDTARLAAQLCRIAYLDPDAGETGSADQGLGEFNFFDGGASTQGFGVGNEADRYLVFRGTESNNPRDWLTDARFGPRSTSLGRVHSGFDDALDEVWSDVLAHLGTDPRHLTITGHSLGGGLAILAAARLAESGRSPKAVYVFGCPRVGLADFRDAYDSLLQASTFRIINHIDLVTRVPLLVQGYRVPGRRMYFDAGQEFHADAGAWHVAKDDLAYRLRHLGRIESLGLSTHEMGVYIERVNSL